MKNRAIGRSERKNFFDLVSRMVQGQQIEIEVAGLDVGDQIEEDWALLLGLSYDTKDEIIYVDTPAFEHSIFKPEEILSVQNDQVVSSIYIKDSVGHVQSLKFRTPLLLEQPHAHP